MRSHSPLTFFIGYFVRRSPMVISRALAPLQQWVPWLIGLSTTGSWPIQTPFWTSAQIEQPTEQKGQMVFLRMISVPISCASARWTVPPAPIPAMARPPMPLARRKSRREKPPEAVPLVLVIFGLIEDFGRTAISGLRRLSISGPLPVSSLRLAPHSANFERGRNRSRYDR